MQANGCDHSQFILGITSYVGERIPTIGEASLFSICECLNANDRHAQLLRREDFVQTIRALRVTIGADTQKDGFLLRLLDLFADLAATVFTGSPADFAKLIADETEKWAKVIRAANIKAE